MRARAASQNRYADGSLVTGLFEHLTANTMLHRNKLYQRFKWADACA